jgi:hypothetical protein
LLKEIVLCFTQEYLYIAFEFRRQVSIMVWQWFSNKYSSLKYPTIIKLVLEKPNITTLNDSIMHFKNVQTWRVCWGMCKKYSRHYGIQCMLIIFIFLFICVGFWWNIYVVFRLNENTFVYQVIQS